MQGYPKFLEKLIEELSKLPTIGPKSAERMALYLIRVNPQQSKSLAEAINNAREHTRKCRLCNYFTEQELCPICQDRQQREKVMCVVEDPQDVMAIEKTGRFKGVYHVLWGNLSPLDGTGPEDLSMKKLAFRVREENIAEVIVATSSGREGETTAQYLRQLLKPCGIKITRIARGLPMGSTIGYIDQATISEALEGRREVSA